MNPFGRSNDIPKDPLNSMVQNGTINPDTSMNVPPGGRSETQIGSAEGDRMQYARQGGQSYKGSMVYNNSSPSAKVFGRIDTPK